MLYNTLKQFTHRHALHLSTLVDAATLFTLDMAPHESLAKSWDAAKRDRMMREFSLPYMITAVEDRAGCVVLAEPKTGARGLATERFFIDCVPGDMTTDLNAYSDDIDTKLALRDLDLPAGSACVTFGSIAVAHATESQFLAGGILYEVLAGTPETLHMRLTNPSLRDPRLGLMYTSALKNAITAIEEVIHVEGLPGFTGWPQNDEPAIRFGVFDIQHDGRIVESDRHNR